MSKLPSINIKYIESKKIREAILCQADRFGPPKRTDLELVFEDNTCMRFFLFEGEILYTELCPIDNPLRV